MRRDSGKECSWLEEELVLLVRTTKLLKHSVLLEARAVVPSVIVRISLRRPRSSAIRNTDKSRKSPNVISCTEVSMAPLPESAEHHYRRRSKALQVVVDGGVCRGSPHPIVSYWCCFLQLQLVVI